MHGEQVAAGEVWRNVGGSGEMVEGWEELVNPDNRIYMSLESSSCSIVDSRQTFLTYTARLFWNQFYVNQLIYIYHYRLVSQLSISN